MSNLAVSQIEKHFITNEIYKRSRRYFDVIKLKSIERLDSKFRRVPSQAHKQEMFKKIENSFMSSAQYISKKRSQQIEKCKLKHFPFENFDDHDETQTNYSVATKKLNNSANKKVFDMSKSLPRQFYQNLNNPSSSGSDPFDNFISSDFSKGQKGKSIDFNKILGRKDPIQHSTTIYKLKNLEHQFHGPNKKLQSINNPQKDKTQNTNKAYEKFYFDSSKFRCLLDVEKQRKAEQRKSLNINFQEQESKEISLQKRQKGRAMTQKHPTPSCLMFYHGKGKEEASSLDYRLLKQNENYWAEQAKQNKKQDFETVKRREVMIGKRLGEINARKKIYDVKGQICDAKYFLRNQN